MKLIPSLVEAADSFTPWTGHYDEEVLREWIELEFGQADALERPFSYGKETQTRVIVPQNIVHILSGNTPHAAWQTLLRGLLLGAHNFLKLPAHGLPEFEKQIAELPQPLRDKITTCRSLPDHWIDAAGALVVFGNDDTIRHFRQLAPLHIPFIAHGHRLAIGLITDPTQEAARLAVRDAAMFNQQGCLSIHALYVQGDAHAFGDRLSEAFADFEKENPRGEITLSEHGAISDLREETKFLQANAPETYHLWESSEGTDWTIIYRADPTLNPSPLNRTLFIHPYPESFDQLGTLTKNLSGIATQTEIKNLPPAPRIFPLGQAQTPPLIWHHDGLPPLASLVRFQDKRA